MGLHFNAHPWRLDDFGIPPWRNRNFRRMNKLWSPQPPFFYGGPSLTEFCGFLGPRVVTGPLFVVFILLVDLPVFGTWCLNFNFSRDSHGEIPMFIIVYLFSWNLMLKSHTYGCHDLKTWKNGPGIVSTAVSFRAIPWLAIPWVA